ncbi:hypothetical protein RJ641_003194 [Dillenia turbinata]|uniref:Uncharacterized protein n=1 Tax=Dillenia turbinata TaxID=194707 RepID=A0AAN8VK59_9MAGN
MPKWMIMWWVLISFGGTDEFSTVELEERLAKSQVVFYEGESSIDAQGIDSMAIHIASYSAHWGNIADYPNGNHSYQSTYFTTDSQSCDMALTK